MVTLFTFLILALCCTPMLIQRKEPKYKKMRTLVAYFSCSGTTERIAQYIADETGGTLFAITPVEPYTPYDLQPDDPNCRALLEMHNPEYHPPLASRVAHMEQYEVIYLGFPIWCGSVPTVVSSFMASHRLEGKIIVPFYSSNGNNNQLNFESLNYWTFHAVVKTPICVDGFGRKEAVALVKRSVENQPGGQHLI